MRTFLHIKPLSVNEAWKGRRFKTDAYNNFVQHVLMILPHDLVVPNGNLAIHLCFGFSNKGADIDNPVKPILDILQKKYNFNDSRIYKLHVDKIIVPKGSEFIEFEFGEHHAIPRTEN